MVSGSSRASIKAAHTDYNGPTDGQRAGRKRWCGECGDESEQERSRTGGGAGRREQLAPCPSAGAGTRRQAVETELRRGRCGGSDVAGTPTQRPRKLSKRGRARCGTNRTGLILADLRRRGGLRGGVGLYCREKEGRELPIIE
jgi:hypothetical protein